MLNIATWNLLALAVVSAQQVAQDPGNAGPEPELVHLYYDQWPTGAKLEDSTCVLPNHA